MPYRPSRKGPEVRGDGSGGAYVSIRPEIRLSSTAYARLWLRAKWDGQSISRAIRTILENVLLGTSTQEIAP